MLWVLLFVMSITGDEGGRERDALIPCLSSNRCTSTAATFSIVSETYTSTAVTFSTATNRCTSTAIHAMTSDVVFKRCTSTAMYAWHVVILYLTGAEVFLSVHWHLALPDRCTSMAMPALTFSTVFLQMHKYCYACTDIFNPFSDRCTNTTMHTLISNNYTNVALCLTATQLQVHKYLILSDRCMSTAMHALND